MTRTEMLDLVIKLTAENLSLKEQLELYERRYGKLTNVPSKPAKILQLRVLPGGQGYLKK